MATIYSLNRRNLMLVITAAFFLLFLISLHKQVPPPPSVTPNEDQELSPPSDYTNRCPVVPPNPPYTRTTHRGFNWRDLPTKYPVETLIELPSRDETPSSSLPKIQFDFQTPLPPPDEETRKERQAAIKETFQRAWRSYEKYAWKQDELKPVSGGSTNTFGGWGATLFDNLDTLLIMDMHEEFNRAVKALVDINFDPERSSQSTINVFETTIRYLGGLIAAYDLTGCNDARLLDKAVQIADMIYASYDTPSRMPVTRWNPHKAAGGEEQVAPTQGILAEVASSSLEFTRLSQLTGDMRYFDAISRITNTLEDQQPRTRIPGLWPFAVDARAPDFTRGTAFTFGGMSDSAYEYLGKMYQLLDGTGGASQYQKLYDEAMAAGEKHLLFRPMTHDHADILVPTKAQAPIPNEPPIRSSTGEHLACFAGGMYALGGRLFDNENHLTLGRKITDGCIWLYRNSPHGIMPEIFSMTACPSFNECQWDETQEDVFTGVRDGQYKLRPEAVESVFYLYRITGDEKLRDAGWEMFQAIDLSTRTEFANAALRNVMEPDPQKEDSMESFWMAETLKYLYLLFSEPDVISLDEFVLNTEAHPFRIPR